MTAAVMSVVQGNSDEVVPCMQPAGPTEVVHAADGSPELNPACSSLSHRSVAS